MKKHRHDFQQLYRLAQLIDQGLSLPAAARGAGLTRRGAHALLRHFHPAPHLTPQEAAVLHYTAHHLLEDGTRHPMGPSDADVTRALGAASDGEITALTRSLIDKGLLSAHTRIENHISEVTHPMDWTGPPSSLVSALMPQALREHPIPGKAMQDMAEFLLVLAVHDDTLRVRLTEEQTDTLVSAAAAELQVPPPGPWPFKNNVYLEYNYTVPLPDEPGIPDRTLHGVIITSDPGPTMRQLVFPVTGQGWAGAFTVELDTASWEASCRGEPDRDASALAKTVAHMLTGPEHELAPMPTDWSTDDLILQRPDQPLAHRPAPAGVPGRARGRLLTMTLVIVLGGDPTIPAQRLEQELGALHDEERRLRLRLEHQPSAARDTALAWARLNQVPFQYHGHPQVVVIPGSPVRPSDPHHVQKQAVNAEANRILRLCHSHDHQGFAARLLGRLIHCVSPPNTIIWLAPSHDPPHDG